MADIQHFKLEPDSDEIREMLHITSEKIISFLENIADPEYFDSEESKQIALQESESLPEEEQPLKALLDELFDHKIKHAFKTTHPGFMAYIPGGGLFHSALADFIAKVTNRYVGIDIAAPLLNQIEADVLKWFYKIIGFPDSSGGTLTSGGSIANLTAVICARTILLGNHFMRGTVYASSFVHHSMWKAFQAAGIPSGNIRDIPVTESFQLNHEQLQITINEDIKNGFHPFMIVATAGSTNTGTIDPVKKIAVLAKKANAWFHIDAAYGGFFAMTERGKKQLAGIELADSITLDPHKGLFLPYGTGAFIVRDRQKLKQVFTHEADYIPVKTTVTDTWDFSEMSLELIRPFRGLGVWLPFKTCGAETFRKALDKKLDLAIYFHQQLALNKSWQIIAPPELSLTVFRFHNHRFSKEKLNQINHKIVEYVNKKGRAIISGTVISGNFVLRSCILSFRTHQLYLDYLIEDLEEGLGEVLQSKDSNKNE